MSAITYILRLMQYTYIFSKKYKHYNYCDLGSSLKRISKDIKELVT